MHPMVFYILQMHKYSGRPGNHIERHWTINCTMIATTDCTLHSRLALVSSAKNSQMWSLVLLILLLRRTPERAWNALGSPPSDLQEPIGHTSSCAGKWHPPGAGSKLPRAQGPR